MPLTHRGAGRLRAQLRGVTVERCGRAYPSAGIFAGGSGSVELTGCSLLGNGTDYGGGGTITADGRRVG